MLDARARVTMTLHLGQQALQNENSAVAMMVAEEILDEEPDNTEALLLLCESAMRCGHAPLALVATEQLEARGVVRPTLSAATLLAAVRPAEALAAAERAIALAPYDARAHAIRGQALELLQRTDEAEVALATAAQIDARRYPPPYPVDDWDTILLEALSGLTDEERTEARSLPVTFLDSPSPTWLTETGAPFPPVPPTTFGGPDLSGVVLFRRNLARGAADRDEVVERARNVVSDELTARRQRVD